MNWLYPIVTGRTFIDTSSAIHLAFWVFLGSCFAYSKFSTRKSMIWMALIAYGWEFFERFAEKKWTHIWLHPESWLNSYVSDPLMGAFGVWLAYWLVRNQ